MEREMFEVDPEGLAALIEDQGPSRLIAELIANSLDADGATTIKIECSPVDNRPLLRFLVEDDSPRGFADLSHAFTLFAKSGKLGDATKAGRFNLGEKILISCAVATNEPCYVESTTGSFEFTKKSGRRQIKEKRNKGSCVHGCLKATRSQIESEILPFIRSILVPKSIVATLNGERLPTRTPLTSFVAKLPTVLDDGTGILRNTQRQCTVEIYEPLGGEVAGIFELGMPVVETGDKYHVNVLQKIPLNFNRDNVTPAYLKTIRTLVLNETASLLKQDEANNSWVREAASDSRATPAVVETVLTHRFGEKRVAFNPKDLEANAQAVANGFTVIHGREMNKDEWENVREKAPLKSSAEIFPTGSPYSTDMAAPSATFLSRDNWTSGIKRVVHFAEWLHGQIFGTPVVVRVLHGDSGLKADFIACYGRRPDNSGGLDFNLTRLGQNWFESFSKESFERQYELILHEFAHWYSRNHLCKEYHEGLSRIAAKTVRLIVEDKEAFERAMI